MLYGISAQPLGKWEVPFCWGSTITNKRQVLM